jgi:hypothetical protein
MYKKSKHKLTVSDGVVFRGERRCRNVFIELPGFLQLGEHYVVLQSGLTVRGQMSNKDLINNNMRKDLEYKTTDVLGARPSSMYDHQGQQ